MTYTNSIISACLIFPVIALLVTIPYIIAQYHKYGSISFLRVLIVYSFILYLLVAYFLIILPLPDVVTVQNMKGLTTQLIPFRFIVDIVNNVHSLRYFYKYQEVYQVFFNMLLTVPFGIYLRYYFECDLKKTALLTFLLSLFFEITQLTGLYFIYPRAYRLFDVDDLMINTLGGVIGYELSKLFTFFLPSRDEIDNTSYKKGMKISFLRRLTSVNIDILIIALLFTITSILTSKLPFRVPFIVNLTLTFLINNVLIPVTHNGQTLAKKIVNIKIVSEDGSKCIWYQYLIRYFFLYVPLFGYYYLFIFIYKILINYLSRYYLIGYVIINLLCIFTIIIYIFINNIIMKKRFLYEKISKTKNESTIKVPKE